MIHCTYEILDDNDEHILHELQLDFPESPHLGDCITFDDSVVDHLGLGSKFFRVVAREPHVSFRLERNIRAVHHDESLRYAVIVRLSPNFHHPLADTGASSI